MLDVNKIINETAIKRPDLVLLLSLWLKGESSTTLSRLGFREFENFVRELNNINIQLNIYEEYARIGNITLNRYSTDLTDLLNEEAVNAISNYLTELILEKAKNVELKYLVYVFNYLKEIEKIDIQGLSNYIITCEKYYPHNVDFDIVNTLTKYLLCTFNSREGIFSEYPWTRKVLSELVSRSMVRIKGDNSYFIKVLDDLVSRYGSFGLSIIAALHSTSHGRSDHFHQFHNVSTENMISKLGDLECVVYKNVINHVAVKYLNHYLLTRALNIYERISQLLTSQGFEVSKPTTMCDFISGTVSTSGKWIFKIVIPTPYYLSPIFWGLSTNALYVVYNTPFSIESYLDCYRAYLINSLIIFTNPEGVVEVYEIDLKDKHLEMLINFLKKL